MKCETVKELILTDYVDEQLSEEKKKLVEQHLTMCEHCREYGLLTKEFVIEPFNYAERINPPMAAWHTIKEQIEGEEREGPCSGLIFKIKTFLFIPKPALAVASVVVVLLLMLTLIKSPSNNQTTLNGDPENQVECITYLLSIFDQDSANENDDLGTSIEDFFL
ncbi:MAG: zf-HC2 domain-containing protein [Candidatus Scalindua sp.]|nr:zf-HC2 domain-containing protein [Candidatus Scalindua sp.]